MIFIKIPQLSLPGLKHSKPVLRLSVALATLYVGLSLASFLYPNPFWVAREEAQVLGGWDAEQVQFMRGRYNYGVFGSSVEAELRILTPGETLSAHIELSHSLWSGWAVSDFHVPKENESALPIAGSS